jgi:hypothetical protein
MSETDQEETADASPASTGDVNALIASLRNTGADLFDPVRVHYIEALAKRANALEGHARHVLETKLAKELAALKERFAHAQNDAREVLTLGMQHYPHAAGTLQQSFNAGDFKELRKSIFLLKSDAQRMLLADLVRDLGQQAAGDTNVRPWEKDEARAELKTIRNFRNTWSKLSVDKQVAQALEQAPKNAGPINSHMLVLRSLALMRDISPDYLNRFISYAETLLSLDQHDKEKTVSPKKQSTKLAKK